MHSVPMRTERMNSCGVILPLEPLEGRGMLRRSDLRRGSVRTDGRGRHSSGATPKRFNDKDGGAFVYFSDPDGKGWAVQEFRGSG